MSTRELHATGIDAALQAEQRPITPARALEIARKTLDRSRYDQFVKWFEANGARLLENLNNGR